MTMTDKKQVVETKVYESPHKRQKHIQGRHTQTMKKLDTKMVQWIIRERHKGNLSNSYSQDN